MVNLKGLKNQIAANFESDKNLLQCLAMVLLKKDLTLTKGLILNLQKEEFSFCTFERVERTTEQIKNQLRTLCQSFFCV